MPRRGIKKIVKPNGITYLYYKQANGELLRLPDDAYLSTNEAIGQAIVRAREIKHGLPDEKTRTQISPF